MVNRNGSRGTTRTPRKAKEWAYIDETRLLLAANNDTIDLLAAYKTDLGVLQTRNLTIMRIIGRIQLQEFGDPVSSSYVSLRLGFLWLNVNVTSLNQVPWEPGTRETEWIQLGGVEGSEGATAQPERPASARPPENCQWDVDITQMRKQPTPQHTLRLVYSTNGLQEATILGLHIRLGMFLALP